MSVVTGQGNYLGFGFKLKTAPSAHYKKHKINNAINQREQMENETQSVPCS